MPACHLAGAASSPTCSAEGKCLEPLLTHRRGSKGCTATELTTSVGRGRQLGQSAIARWSLQPDGGAAHTFCGLNGSVRSFEPARELNFARLNFFEVVIRQQVPESYLAILVAGRQPSTRPVNVKVNTLICASERSAPSYRKFKGDDRRWRVEGRSRSEITKVVAFNRATAAQANKKDVRSPRVKRELREAS